MPHSTPPRPRSQPIDPKKQRSLDDSASILSRSTTSSTLHTQDALVEIAGTRVRHAACPPEFLEAVAARSENGSDSQVKIITGLDASAFFVKYLGEQGNARSKRTTEGRAVVFAVTAWSHNRSCVDYYMSWRKSSGNPLKEHTITELDEEFRRVARRIDKDYNAFRRAGSVASTGSIRSEGSHRRRNRSMSPTCPSTRTTTTKKRPDPIPLQSAKDEKLVPDIPGLPEQPASATDSVISLPYLNMIRGVPRGNRMPLFVTNPDRLSTYSELEVPVITPQTSSDGSSKESQESTTYEAKPVLTSVSLTVTPPDTKTPVEATSNHHFESSGLTPLMKSSASIRSTETHSSRSSQSTQGSSDSRRSTKSKSSRGSSPSRKEKDRDGRRSDRERRKHRDREGRKEKDELDEEEGESTTSSIKFLIVVLGDKLEKEGITWHGLDRQVSSRTQQRSAHKDRSSPWIGPLVRAEYLPHPQYRTRPNFRQLGRRPLGKSVNANDSDSDASYDEGGWQDSPVVPLKPFLDSMGFVPTVGQDMSMNYPQPVIPAGMVPFLAAGSQAGSMIASPAPSAARQLRYSTYSNMSAAPGMSPGSPYVPPGAWAGLSMAGSTAGGGSPAGSQPPSRVPSAMGGYGTPYMRHAY